MISQVLLSLGLLIVAFYSFTQRTRSRTFMRLMLFVCVVGEVLVMVPSLSTRAANLVGIGRGADLITYLFIVAGLGITLGVNLRLYSQQEELTNLARAIALSSAAPPEEGSSSGAT
jgi:hypothetical protein